MEYFFLYYRRRHLGQLFLSKFSFVCCVGLQWWHLTAIQLRVGFVLLTFILKCSMPTFTFCFSIYFDPKIYIYLLCSCLSKLATHAVYEDKLKKKTQIDCLLNVSRCKVNRNVTCKATDMCSMEQNNILQTS